MNKKEKRLAELTLLVHVNLAQDGDPKERLGMIEEAIVLALECDWEEEILEGMYSRRAHAMQQIAERKKINIHEQPVNQHNYRVIGEAMREFFLEKEPKA